MYFLCSVCMYWFTCVCIVRVCVCVCVYVRVCVCVSVEAGHRAVIFDRFKGITDYIAPEGSHFLIPIIQVLFFRCVCVCVYVLTLLFALRVCVCVRVCVCTSAAPNLHERSHPTSHSHHSYRN